MGAYFNAKGELVSGQTMSAPGKTSSELVVLVDAACERCEKGADGFSEMKSLLTKYPLLKEERFGENHPLLTLVPHLTSNLL